MPPSVTSRSHELVVSGAGSYVVELDETKVAPAPNVILPSDVMIPGLAPGESDPLEIVMPLALPAPQDGAAIHDQIGECQIAVEHECSRNSPSPSR